MPALERGPGPARGDQRGGGRDEGLDVGDDRGVVVDVVGDDVRGTPRVGLDRRLLRGVRGHRRGRLRHGEAIIRIRHLGDCSSAHAGADLSLP